MVIPARPADRVVHAPVGVAAKVGTETPAQVDAPPPSADTIGHQAYAAAAAATNTAKPSAAAKAAPDANAATATDANDTADAANNTATTTTTTTDRNERTPLPPSPPPLRRTGSEVGNQAPISALFTMMMTNAELAVTEALTATTHNQELGSTTLPSRPSCHRQAVLPP